MQQLSAPTRRADSPRQQTGTKTSTHPTENTRFSVDAMRGVIQYSLAFGGLLAAFVAAIAIGAVAIPVGDIFASIWSHISTGDTLAIDPTTDAIIWDIRIPRVVLAAVVGAALSTAGAAYQGVFRNPLADPYLLGAAAGAGVGATLAIGYIQQPQWLTPLAFAGALGGVAAAWTVGSAAGGLRSSAVMLLSGVAVMSFLTAVQTLLQQHRSDSLQQVYAWILGQLSTGGWASVNQAFPGVVIGGAVLLTYGRRLDVFELGDDKARSLGIHVRRTRIIVVAAASLMTASAVAVSGLIGFVGLVVPHMVRRMASSGTSYTRVLPLSMLVGATFLVLTDLLARTVMRPAELPIGVITAFLGAPFFAWLLHLTRRQVMP